MPSLNIRKQYQANTGPLKSDFDAIVADLETFFNVTQINDDNLISSGITASTKVLDESISSGKLASNFGTTAAIASNAITAEKIDSSYAGGGLSYNSLTGLALNVDTDHLHISSNGLQVKTGGLTDTEFVSNAVTVDKVINRTVTQSGLISGSFSGNIGSLTVSLSRGGPVLVGLVSSGNASPMLMESSGSVLFRIEETTTNREYTMKQGKFSGGIWIYDSAASGSSITYTFKVSGASVTITQARIVAMEL